MSIFGGYDCNFVEPPPDDLICLICTLVAKDPHQVTCCGKIYCRDCLGEQKKYSPTCPQCRNRGNSFQDKKSNRSIQQLKVKCSNVARGCDWVGELQVLKSHSDECGYKVVRCPNKCRHENKRVKMLFKELAEHLRAKCPHRLHPKSIFPCTNDGCKSLISKDELFTHRDQCPFETVPCKYENMGCTTELLRKDLQRHESNSQLHLCMENSLRVLLPTTGPPNFTFKMTNFNNHRNKDMAYFSSPFYSENNSYKMCLRVDANGWSTGHNTHISIHVHLMSSENDAHLRWPFVGQVAVTLLNQLQDHRHHVSTFQYVNQRVMGGTRSVLGYGPLCYISHGELGHNPALNRQYLKDDCLFFRVTVDGPGPIKRTQ